MIAFIDDAVGELLGVLEETGLRENTVIVFTSDHGEYMGDFGLLLKGASLTSALTRVPFIWSDASDNFAGGDCGEMFSTVDIAPTILARAGLLPYNGMQGRDMLPVARGEEPAREELLIEFEDNAPKMGFESPAVARTLLTRRYRLTLFLDCEWGELYDLQEDPNETRNLWESPAHADARRELAERLVRRIMAERESSPLPKRRA